LVSLEGFDVFEEPDWGSTAGAGADVAGWGSYPPGEEDLPGPGFDRYYVRLGDRGALISSDCERESPVVTP
jgi:hypothetical protein